MKAKEGMQGKEGRMYRAGAIGHTGRGNYGHGLHVAYKDIENVVFVAVADPDPVGREKARVETGAAHGYADYREMLEQEDLDLVSICPRWTDARLKMLMDGIEAGCHIYCEKPMVPCLEHGDRVIQAADRAGLKIAVAHQGVYLPRIQGIQRLIYEGRIGEVHAIYAHGKQDARGGGEDMIVLATHLFNMMRYFVGDVAWMSAHVTVEGREVTRSDAHEGTEPLGLVAGDCIHSYFAFHSGASGFFDSRIHRGGEARWYGMEIVGSEGMLSLRGGAGEDLVLYPYALWAPSDRSQGWQPLDLPRTPLSAGNRLAILDLIDAIEHDREPLSSARDAVAALEMILGAYASQLTGARIPFPMEHRRHPLEA